MLDRNDGRAFVAKLDQIMKNEISRMLIAALGCAIAWTGASADPRTTNDGVYTDEQADVGEALYAEHCLLCHDKKYFRPVLQRSEGQPASILFAVMSASMPENNPGFLTEKEYVDILAYILSLSRYAAGDTELDYADGALNELTIEARNR